MSSSFPQQDSPSSDDNRNPDPSGDDYHAPERGFLLAIGSSVAMFLPALIIFLVAVVVIVYLVVMR
jgi:hypothetical protein